jgi:NADH-quinone oxidoreductase subunit C
MDPIPKIRERFADQIVGFGEHAGQKWIEVRRERIVDVLRAARDEAGFDVLTDLTAVDHLNRGAPERFCVVYNLYSLRDNDRARVKAWVPEGDPAIDSAVPVWKAAGWAEREVWDLFGIVFRNHPGLKRILLPESYVGHPLRKDYPLTGRGERMSFPRYVP